MKASEKAIRVMTVDDSPTIRRLIASELSGCADIECLDGGAHPYEARERIKAEAPDVLILDIDMPRMNGLDFLRKIMTLRPMPVVMFSSMTKSGSRKAIEALEIGAVDVLVKTPTMSTDGTLSFLPEKVRAAAGARVSPQLDPRPTGPAADAGFQNQDRIVLVGSSTGGVDALETLLSGYPRMCPPTLISQHMPAEFLRNFTLRVNSFVQPVVKLAEDGEPLNDGVVYIAPGGDYHLALEGGLHPRIYLDPQGKVTGHRPSVDVLFESGVPFASRIVAAILTGMGSDGANGMKSLRDAGARTMAQDEATCTVFGMPRVALERGGAERALPLERIAASILEICAEPMRAPGRKRGTRT